MKKQLWATLMSVAIVLAGAGSALAAASVTTDKADYPPGATVQITGTGFQPGEIVELQVLNLTDPTDIGPEHDPWEVTADSAGDFQTTWEVTADELGATLQLTARGQSSARTAQTVFTDATVTAATGGSAISADTAGGSWTSLTGPTITETAVADLPASGTIVLWVPAGFVFDTNTPVPNIKLTSGDTGSPNKNINNTAVNGTMAVTTTPTNITFTLTAKSSGNTLCTLLYQNIRVRPTAGTPLASGNITNSGTAVPNVGSLIGNYGTLTEAPGTATKLAFGVGPSTTSAGSAISPAVTGLVQDQFGNTVTGNSSTVTISSGNTAFAGDSTLSVAAVNGVATFSNLKPTTAGSGKTLTASDGSLTGATSSAFTVNPVTANAYKITANTQTPPRARAIN